MNADVVIVGGGPVGMTMSIACSRLGLSNVVIEREPEAFPLPRAIVMDVEVHRSLLRHDHRTVAACADQWRCVCTVQWRRVRAVQWRRVRGQGPTLLMAATVAPICSGGTGWLIK
jgi:2-polyprenyl-6-methoxyphenol hydroxylase-like FAD-dependent oxidoreductase